MEHSEFLELVSSVFDRLNLAYYVTGSSASIYYGEYRYTSDVDVVVDLPLEQVDALCQQFPPDNYYVSTDAARAAVRTGGMFNIILPTEGLKLDVIVTEQTEFARSCMARRSRQPMASGAEPMFGSPEDVIVNKLRYYQEGGSEKHLRDIVAMLKVQREKIDREYIRTWTDKLGLSAEWQILLDRAAGPSNV